MFSTLFQALGTCSNKTLGILVRGELPFLVIKMSLNKCMNEFITLHLYAYYNN